MSYCDGKIDAQSKNIVLFMDGTWNARDGLRHTNVLQLFDATLEVENKQIRHYIPGVGAAERLSKGRFKSPYVVGADIKPPLANWPLQCIFKSAYKWIRQLFGGVSGLGTDFNIKEAYAFLCAHYSAQNGDKIFLFGFSRGAFSARSLAGFVDKVGLKFRGNLQHVEEAFSIYQNDSSADELKTFMDSLDIPYEDRGELPIYFIGVWDTVNALGIPGCKSNRLGRLTKYHQVELPKAVTHARHALSLHELRSPFSPVLWNGCSRKGQELQQVWFAGSHADVGGGYCEGARGLSNIALSWIAQEAEEQGLQLLCTDFGPQSHLNSGAVHHEIKRLFFYLVPEVRYVLMEPQDFEVALESFSIHSTALERLRHEGGRQYRFFHPTVNWRLSDADDATLRLHLLLSNKKYSDSTINETVLGADWWKTANMNELRLAHQTVKKFISLSVDLRAPSFIGALRALVLLWAAGDVKKFSDTLLVLLEFFAYLCSGGELGDCRQIIVHNRGLFSIYANFMFEDSLAMLSAAERFELAETVLDTRLEALHQQCHFLNCEQREAQVQSVKKLLLVLCQFVSGDFASTIEHLVLSTESYELDKKSDMRVDINWDYFDSSRGFGYL